MKSFSLPESLLNQLIDAVCRGIGAASFPLTDAVRAEIHKQITNQESGEIPSSEDK